ncbi:PRTRC system protein A [Sphingobium sp. DC-2]|uniref:PRTRC system protein A n=1 Tax=Sphingobium sp. DC-2 TaxID=1303256 RepID=UPI0004C356B7|nr:PRTRC system protein A [Sphingobium sp. DC-2]
MTVLADDPTAAALLAAFPCFPAPPTGRSPGLDAVRASRVGHCLAVGRDGVFLIVRRPWLELEVPVTSPIAAYLPYGAVGAPRADLRCGLIPRTLLDEVITQFRAALPNEAAAFIVWDEVDRAFSLHMPEIDEATPSRLIYRTPILPSHRHIVCDIHSHGHGRAFFSATDDADDVHATKIALVLGRVAHPDGPDLASRLCAGGMFLPLPRSPFDGDGHDG